MSEWAGRRVTVMGLGHFGGGVSAARWLAQQGAQVTVTDLADAARLESALTQLADVPLAATHLGGHCEADFRAADLVVVNPAVRPGSPYLAIARGAGVPCLTEVELLMRAAPGRIVGVTGSNGKSTTTAMIAALLRAAGRRAWLGGNIGGSLLEKLSEMQADDWLVLELSSFQLHYLSDASRGPDVAVATNCVPNHLNWHPDFAHYVQSKQRLLTRQASAGVAVLNTADAEVSGWGACVRGRRVSPWPDARLPVLRVPGQHNRVNAGLAAAAVEAIGCPTQAIVAGLQAFAGLPQRLEMFAVVGGRYFYNDSAATTPESTAVALEAIAGPVWLLAGGSAKGADFAAMLATIARRATGVAFYGAVGEQLGRGLRDFSADLPCQVVADLPAALEWCWQKSGPGHTILLSPGCASLDQFINYRHRGETFAKLVQSLAARVDRPGLTPRPGETPPESTGSHS